MSSSLNANSRWSLTPHRAEVMDLLRRQYETRAASDRDAVYDSRSVSELHAALNRALALDEVAHEVTRPLCKQDIEALLAERFGTRHEDEGAD